MSAYRLRWKATPPGFIDGAVLRPDRLAVLGPDDVAREPLRCGNRAYRLGEVFTIEPLGERAVPHLWVDGAARFVQLGAGMCSGTLEVDGPAGALAGCGMRGGRMRVRGDVLNLAGAGMRDGLLVIEGNAAGLLGAPLPGEVVGMAGGEIVVHGDAGPLAGLRQRRGLIAVAGSVGPYPGHHMLAGTILVGRGELHSPGIGMRRGTVIGLEARPALPANFRRNGPTRPVFLRLLFRRLEELDVKLPVSFRDKDVLSFSGDWLSLGRGEILCAS